MVPEPERHRGGATQIQKESDGSYLASGQLPADDLAEYLGIEDPGPPTYKTAAGLVLAYLKHLPSEGERLTISNWTIEVVRVDARSILQLRLIPPSETGKTGKANL